MLRKAGKGYVLGVAANHVFHSWGKTQLIGGTAAKIAQSLRKSAWRRLPSGEGTKGPRLHDWAYLELADLDAGEYNDPLAGEWTRGMLIRRNIADGELAFFSIWCPKGTPMKTLVLVEGLFTGMLSQRMQELSQQAAPPFIGGSSNISRLTARYKSYTAFAALGKGGAMPAIDALVQENERARQFGFSAGELERAKKNLMRFYERAYNERDKTDSASYVGEYVRNFLEQESIPGIESEYRYVQELVPGITLDEINKYTRETIPDSSAKLVVYMGNTHSDTPIPTSAQLLASVSAAEKATVTARDDKAVAANLMDQPPKPGSITSETHDAALGLTRLTLSNGVKVILKPTDFRNDQVLMSAVRFGGQMLFDEADAYNSRYASSIIASMGLKDYSPLDLQKVLAGKSASVRAGLGSNTDIVSGSAGSNDIETMLQLVHLQFNGVRRDSDLYKSFIARQVDAARNAMTQPELVFRDTIITTLYDNHPRVARTPSLRAPAPPSEVQVKVDGSFLSESAASFSVLNGESYGTTNFIGV